MDQFVVYIPYRTVECVYSTVSVYTVQWVRIQYSEAVRHDCSTARRWAERGWGIHVTVSPAFPTIRPVTYQA